MAPSAQAELPDDTRASSAASASPGSHSECGRAPSGLCTTLRDSQSASGWAFAVSSAKQCSSSHVLSPHVLTLRSLLKCHLPTESCFLASSPNVTPRHTLRAIPTASPCCLLSMCVWHLLKCVIASVFNADLSFANIPVRVNYWVSAPT